MYEAFYGLKENPFGTTPDPRYLYKSRGHREALAYQAQGVFLKKGFLVVTGEVGVGKTTVVRAFMQIFNPCLDVSFVINTRVDFREMLYMLLSDFGVEIKDDSKIAMLSQLNEFLIGRFAENRNPVIVIDEAQNLTPEVLEELRMLSNLETNQQKLIQIVLVGQPELYHQLERADLRQLRQRIPGICKMKLLSRDEVYRYIRYRLAVAGLANGQLAFAEDSLDTVIELSSGIPRLINMLCDRVLLRGYLKRVRAIDAEIVLEAARELGILEESEPAVPRAVKRVPRERADQPELRSEPGGETATVKQPLSQPDAAVKKRSVPTVDAVPGIPAMKARRRTPAPAPGSTQVDVTASRPHEGVGRDKRLRTMGWRGYGERLRQRTAEDGSGEGNDDDVRRAFGGGGE